ncbi:kinase-like domain-containing protein, partial [Mycena epipterygia]
GLNHLHNKLRIIHEDIKPAKILTGHEGHCVIPDYGSCEILDSNPSYNRSTKQILKAPRGVGTPFYRAPETMFTGLSGFTQFDERVDVWSLGVTIYALITLRSRTI